MTNRFEKETKGAWVIHHGRKHAFVNSPGAFHKFVNPLIDDSFDLAKALVSALSYGMMLRHPSRGRIISVDWVLNALIQGRTRPCNSDRDTRRKPSCAIDAGWKRNVSDAVAQARDWRISTSGAYQGRCECGSTQCTAELAYDGIRRARTEPSSSS